MNTVVYLAEWAVRSSILVIAAALLLRALRVKDASIRGAAWTAVLIASLAMPLLTAAVPSLPVIVRRAAIPPATQVVAIATLPSLPIAAHQANNAASAAIRPRINWTLAALAIYCLIALALLARLIVGLMLSLRILGRSRPTGRDRILESDQVTAPVTLGILHPAIVLPADWREWDAAKLEAVLAHERSHIERGDPAVQLLSSLHQALLWHSPLSWFLHRRIVRVAEEASDDAALAATLDRAFYAEVLLGFMRRGVRAGLPGVAMARYDSPAKRIDRILDGSALSRGVTRGSLAAILVLASPVTYLIAAAQPQAAPPAPPAPAAIPAPLRALPAPPAPAALRASVAEPAPAPAPAAPAAEVDAALPAEPAPEPQAAPSSDIIRRYMIFDGDMTSGSWDSRDPVDGNALRARYGRHFAWFRQGAHEYVITDAGMMAEIHDAMLPQEEVNHQQNAVNAEQSNVNALQSAVNVQQNEVNQIQRQVNQMQDIINRLQSAVNNGSADDVIRRLEEALAKLRAAKNSATQRDVQRAQDRVNQAQARVNDEQAKVNALQNKVNAAQSSASVEINRRLQDAFESAIDRHLAQQLK